MTSWRARYLTASPERRSAFAIPVISRAVSTLKAVPISSWGVCGSCGSQSASIYLAHG
jgi:hypothetical protein